MLVNLSQDDYQYIAGGSFRMGSPEDEKDRRPDERAHMVKVSSFYMARHPVTVAQFAAYKYNILKKQNSLHSPVVGVNWYEAVEYAKWLSKLKQCTARLPTEAEWEYACRAGTTTPFNTGNILTTEQANFDNHYPHKNYPKDRRPGNTTLVGHFAPNQWGLYDMHGNVWEWCSDWYGDSYYEECRKKGIVENPTGPETGSYRALRGGSWSSLAQRCRSAARYWLDPADGYVITGFRLVIEEMS